MAEGLRKMNKRECGRKLSQSTEFEYYPHTTGEHDLKFLIIYKALGQDSSRELLNIKLGIDILLKWVQQSIFYNF
jgi:hypothetical protein